MHGKKGRMQVYLDSYAGIFIWSKSFSFVATLCCCRNGKTKFKLLLPSFVCSLPHSHPLCVREFTFQKSLISNSCKFCLILCNNLVCSNSGCIVHRSWSFISVHLHTNTNPVFYAIFNTEILQHRCIMFLWYVVWCFGYQQTLFPTNTHRK